MTATPPSDDTVVDWINRLTTVGAPENLLRDLCDRLAAAGVPLYRGAVYVRTLHPNLIGRRFVWRDGAEVVVGDAPYEIADTEEYSGSMIVEVIRTGNTIRRRIEDPDCPMDYGALHEFRDEGITDYLIHPLVFTSGENHPASWATRRKGGFSEQDIATLEAVRGPLARLSEIYSLRRTAVTLLRTYVGRGPGARIWQGHIRRGDTESIRAVIWLSDLRGFTRRADTMPGDALVGLLNRFFDCQVPVIEDAGGQVLKFMGDGLLAIFPLDDDGGSETEACRAAIDAARAFRRKVAAENDALSETGEDPLRFGLALHLGEVLFGNIGGASRLDFTTIGPGVNLAARLEKLAGELGRDVVVSAEFASLCADPLEPLGRHELRGFAGGEEVYGLSENPLG